MVLYSSSGNQWELGDASWRSAVVRGEVLDTEAIAYVAEDLSCHRRAVALDDTLEEPDLVHDLALLAPRRDLSLRHLQRIVRLDAALAEGREGLQGQRVSPEGVQG